MAVLPSCPAVTGQRLPLLMRQRPGVVFVCGGAQRGIEVNELRGRCRELERGRAINGYRAA